MADTQDTTTVEMPPADAPGAGDSPQDATSGDDSVQPIAADAPQGAEESAPEAPTSSSAEPLKVHQASVDVTETLFDDGEDYSDIG